jgi:LuxR family transcriptional regulator
MLETAEALGCLSPVDSEDELWRKLHKYAGARFGVTSILYGFAHSKYVAERIGITKSLLMRHSHPREYIDAFGESSFLDNDIASSSIIDDPGPVLWHGNFESKGLTEAQKRQAAIDDDFQMGVGVSFGFRFADGQGVGGIGLCTRGLSAVEFEKIWSERAAELTALVFAFDVCMRERMVESRLKLSPRERDVLAYSAGGLTAKEIAAHLGLRPKTVYNTLERARKSLKSASTMEAVAKAYVYRLI